MNSRPRSSRRAFTLVELLVVTAIIALLIAILLPSLQRAREVAKTAACASNLRQSTICLQMYFNDYKETFPYGAPLPEDQSFWPGGAPGNAWDGVPPQEQFLKYCGGNTKIFTCPTDQTPENYIWWAYVSHPNFVGETNRSSYTYCEHAMYAYNLYTPGGAALKRQLRRSDVRSPSKWGWSADGWECPNGWNWAILDPNDIITPYHRIDWTHLDNINMVFGDGHLALTPQLDLRNQVYCDPMKQ